MKKSLFFLAVAAVALASCSSDDTIAENSNVGKNQQKEIAFMPLTQPTTRTTVVTGTTFPTDYNFYIAAYNATAPTDYFDKTEYTNETSTTTWSGVEGSKRYWPLGAAKLNFLAITKAGNRTTTFGEEISDTRQNFAKQVVVNFTDNHSDQHDLMYSFARAEVKSVTGGLSFNNGESAGVANVPMAFKHGEALVNFTVKTAADYSSFADFTLTSITLNDAIYAGTYTVTLSNFNSPTSDLSALGVWSGVTDPTTSNDDVVAPQTTENMAITSSSGSSTIGDGILVVPNPNKTSETLHESFKSFTVAYTMKGQSYSYTVTPTDAQRRFEPGKKYIFNITFTLTEIKVTATVTDWGTGFTGDAGNVSIP